MCCTWIVALTLVLAPVPAVEPVEDAGAEVFEVPCVETATYTVFSPAGRARIAGPRLAVVETEIRPKRTRLFLDGRLIGVAKDFRGSWGYLYLRPGKYRLEARLGGYRTAVFEIEADDLCVFRLKHRMARLPGIPKEGPLASSIPSWQVQRVFGPAGEQPSRTSARVRGQAGPDPSLRPDFGSRTPSRAEERSRDVGAAIRVEIEPAAASVYLDGSFVGTAAELEGMVEPLAVAPGSHLIQVLAPGREPYEERFEVARGEVRELQVVLHRSQEAGHPPGDAL
jgi:hypothetical protein